MSFADAFNQQGGGGFGGGMQMGGGEVDELSRESKAVASMIFQMTTNVSSFKRLVDTLGTAKDTRELRTKLQRQREAIGQVGNAQKLNVFKARLARSSRVLP